MPQLLTRAKTKVHATEQLKKVRENVGMTAAEMAEAINLACSPAKPYDGNKVDKIERRVIAVPLLEALNISKMLQKDFGWPGLSSDLFKQKVKT